MEQSSDILHAKEMIRKWVSKSFTDLQMRAKQGKTGTIDSKGRNLKLAQEGQLSPYKVGTGWLPEEVLPPRFYGAKKEKGQAITEQEVMAKSHKVAVNELEDFYKKHNIKHPWPTDN